MKKRFISMVLLALTLAVLGTSSCAPRHALPPPPPGAPPAP
ncbi:hypothetical protein HDF19_09030 [Mucilaginibacter sp. E4BP6]|nr:hypothetical protein [Mucilaginibacter sp. E4BP6]NYE67618.1 hypothetical protein [Mucilaginibacter sp. E4BP6]